MILSSAPGRAGIVGNPTDMYGGAVISCSVPQRAYCLLANSESLTIEVSGNMQEIHGHDDLKMRRDNLDIARAVLKWFNITPGQDSIRLRVTTEIPEQAGLSGSTAMLVAVMGAVTEHLGIQFSRYEIAETARKIEARVMGITCGYQDQYMVTFGGLNYMEFRDKEQLGQTDDEPYATVERLDAHISGLPLILAHTGIMRNSGMVHKSIRERWMEGEPAVVNGYLRIATLARLAKKALLTHNLEDVGALMNENHAIQRDLGGSGESNEVLISAALESGAYGAKLAGAGKGGTIIALARDIAKTTAALKEAGAQKILYPRPCDGVDVITPDKIDIRSTSKTVGDGEAIAASI